MKMKIQVLATTMLVASFSGNARESSPLAIEERGIELPKDASARNYYIVYGECGQIVAELRVHSYEEVIAFLNTLPAGTYDVEERKKGGAVVKRRIIVYTTTT